MPSFAETIDAWRLLGIAQVQQGKLAEATVTFRQLLALNPADAEAHNNLGFVLDRLEKLEEAESHYCEAIRLRPEYADAHYNLAIVRQRQGKLEQAAAGFRQALSLNPGDADGHNNLGVVLLELGQLNEAEECCRQACQLSPRHAAAPTNLGNALARQGKLEEAVLCHERALRLNPTSPAACTNLGNVRRQQARFEEALSWYDKALYHDAGHKEAHLNRAHVWLLLGQWLKGWPEFEWRWQMSGPMPSVLSQLRWDGSPLAGRTLLVTAEQGLGDTLQFLRFVPLLSNSGGSVILQCQPRLLPLLAKVQGIDRIVAAGEPVPTFDVQVPLLSLPGIFGTTLDHIPATIPYLRADPDLVENWRRKLRPLHGFKVGIAWQGNPAYPGDSQRSIPLERFTRLADIEGVRLVSLQKGNGSYQLPAFSFQQDLASKQLPAVLKQMGIYDLGPDFDEAAGPFMDAAAAMVNLDLVICSDSAVAHLAGGLGVPVWLALPMIPDWRWLLERTDSPWYPTMRLFRQKNAGQWQDVFERMRRQVTQFVQ